MWRIEICQIISILLFLGLPSEVSVNGKNTTGAFHHVGIIRSTSHSSVWCGGSVISNKTIVTAAHCIESFHHVTIVLPTPSDVWYKMEATNIKIHPKWRPKLLRHDLALVELPRPSGLPDLYPIEPSFRSKIAPKQRAIVYGWEKGHPQPTWTQYQTVIVSNEDCARYYGRLVTKYTVCAATTDHGKGCHGFSGGGLVVDGLLVGVVSFGAEQCHLGYPTVYTRISRYKKWMENNSDNH